MAELRPQVDEEAAECQLKVPSQVPTVTTASPNPLQKTAPPAQHQVISAAQVAARNAVFGTAELMEQIMLELPFVDIFSSLDVCRQFRDTVLGSKKLRETAFMDAREKRVPTRVNELFLIVRLVRETDGFSRTTRVVRYVERNRTTLIRDTNEAMPERRFACIQAGPHLLPAIARALRDGPGRSGSEHMHVLDGPAPMTLIDLKCVLKENGKLIHGHFVWKFIKIRHDDRPMTFADLFRAMVEGPEPNYSDTRQEIYREKPKTFADLLQGVSQGPKKPSYEISAPRRNAAADRFKNLVQRAKANTTSEFSISAFELSFPDKLKAN